MMIYMMEGHNLFPKCGIRMYSIKLELVSAAAAAVAVAVAVAVVTWM